ncbi:MULTISPECIES: carboxyl transferase domain-containing protein [unclassified Streptomyces]|uniref:acetyl-CoA carboxylase family protein n=1 Tax=unclassified Streptomyces TaxID=2593676 RepID=UPI002E80106F|nr:carboxyl transferase domain-containing protein [Streptomyces sp. NBC_00589]WTI41107.1 ATP-grasp domain-containing protein [Streptomyces sp. NBC_00775]WUB25209.1 ATP-grasp domain-containing protein [Streptomyces sp. NBC_00589]
MGSAAVLVAHRGEIAVRVLRAASELGLRTVAVYTDGDDQHAGRADDAVPLRDYLDADAVVAAARKTGCAFLHPGYGFLSEDAAFARRCAAAGITFVGPSPEVLDLFGDKARARALAVSLGVPVLPGSEGATTLEGAREFLTGGPVMVKAVGGGGGRGMRVVRSIGDLAQAWERCRSEARHSFGRDELYVERLLEGARHIEVQIVGDATGAVTHLWERDCSAQRRHQKLIEIAPAPELAAATREKLHSAALRMAHATRCTGLVTFEFLVREQLVREQRDDQEQDDAFHFIEANPRLQVAGRAGRHGGAGRRPGGPPLPNTCPVLHPSGWRCRASSPWWPGGPQNHGTIALSDNAVVGPTAGRAGSQACGGLVRPVLTDRRGPVKQEPKVVPRSGTDRNLQPSGWRGRQDSLLAKVIAHVPHGFAAACDRARRALGEFEVEGVRTGIPLLRAVLDRPGFWRHTGFVEEHLAELLPAQEDADPVDAGGTVHAPMSGTIVSVAVAPGEPVRAGEQLLVLEAMKMEHVVRAPGAGVVRALHARVGETVGEGRPLVALDELTGATAGSDADTAPDLDAVRPDLAEAVRRYALGLDENRPEAVAKRHAIGRRTARENIQDLCDEGTFTEFGALAIAAQRQRRSLDDLIRSTPADGMVTGTGRVGGGPCVAMSYDYTVLAGTQGLQNHRKTDRMLALAEERRLPVVLFAEGGGGRPGDTDTTSVAGLDVTTFHRMGRLSGLVPLVGVASGRCFAGNAALLSCCDVVIATSDASIGMGGPAMIEGGGLGVYRPEEVGPLSVQVPNGVVDLAVADEAEAVRVARQYLSYFQGAQASWEAPDQRLLRHVVPENRRRAYDMHTAVEALADTGSVLDLRGAFGIGVLTCLVRIEGRPLGLVASNPAHLGGAVDRDAADKTARFLQLCDAFGLPVVSLCDTPGFMVGPDAERTATVRHFARLFVTGANLRVPLVCLVLRKAYGLGAMAMMGGSTRAPLATAAWPSGEFGGMGLEGAVRLGYRKELAAITDPGERERAFEARVAELYEHGKAVNAAAALEIDAVIDPAESRAWILAALDGGPSLPAERGRSFIDTW